jgi:hypothetical protein
MTVIEISSRTLDIFDFSDHEHLITYAEEGFSPLSERLKNLGYTKDEIVEIANHVNELDSYRCLLPDFPVTVIPRRFVRASFNKSSFENTLNKIILTCDKKYAARHLLFDFRTPNVAESIKQSIRSLLINNTQLTSITGFRIEEDHKRESPEFFNALDDFAWLINRIFKNKSRFRSRLGEEGDTGIPEERSKHWFYDADKFHAAKLLQPLDIAQLIRLSNLNRSKEKIYNENNAAVHSFSNFLSVMILTNLISQIVHHSGFQLKDTFGKMLFFPEIVGDCPSTCDFHSEPTVFPNLILDRIRTDFGDEAENTIRYEANNKVAKYLPLVVLYLDSLLDRLVNKHQIEQAKKAVMSYFSAMQSLQLKPNS